MVLMKINGMKDCKLDKNFASWLSLKLKNGDQDKELLIYSCMMTILVIFKGWLLTEGEEVT